MPPIDLERIVSNDEIAVHGRKEAAPVRRMQVDLAMRVGKSTIDAVYKVTRDGRMRIDILAGGNRVYTEAYDGHGGWDWGKDDRVVTDPYAATLWHGNQYPGQIFCLRDVAANGHQLAYSGARTSTA